MGGILGFALGTAMNAAGSFAQAKVQKERQHDDFLLQTYQAHPEYANTPDAQQFLKKKFGPDVADMFMQAGQAAQTFGKDLQGPQGSSAPVGGASPTAGGGTPQGDPMQAHIAELDSTIQRYRGLQAKYANDPSKLQIVSQALNEANQQRNQLTSESFQATKQQEAFGQQEKLLTERGEQSDKKMQEMFEQQDKRLAQSEAFQNDMQGRREQQQNHLADLKDAKTAQDRTLKMKQIIASLGKTTADLTAKLGKGSDYSQQQREMSAESHNQYIQGLMTMTDDPDQVAALKRNLINVAPATPGYLSDTPGAVGATGAESAPEHKVGDVGTVGGKKIRITKIHPDGKTFDYEPAS